MTSTAFTPSSPASVVDAASSELAGLDSVLWAAKRPGELLDTVASIEALESQLAAVKAQAICEVEATGAAASQAWASTKDYLTAIGGGHTRHGASSLRLAQALCTDRTATHAALRAGQVSRAQAQVIISAVDRLPVKAALRDAAETRLLLDAKTLNATELAEAGRLLIELLDPDGSERDTERKLAREERAAHLQRFLAISNDGAGGVRIKGRTTVEDAAVIKAALFALAAPEPAQPGACGGRGTSRGTCGLEDCAHDGRDPRDHGARFLDALVEACRRLQSADVLPESHGATPRITLTMSLNDLTDGVRTGLLDTGDTVSASAVRRLACDADLIPMVLGTDSEVLDVGRTRRLVTAAMWKALGVRDRHCAFPGCTRPPIMCDAHHIEHWVDGGETSLSNLVLLCRAHHATMHQTPWSVRLRPTDQLPEFIPPARLDPEQRPVRQRRPREPRHE